MDIKSIYKYIQYDEDLELFDLTQPTFIYRTDVVMREYEVTRYTEMRIDLILQEMYNLESNEVGLYLENVDVLLYVNNIDNAINIKEGMILEFPAKLEYFEEFRYDISNLESDKLTKRNKLLVPNKTTKKDKNREQYKEDNYLLPPVVLNTPKEPVRIENGKFSVGGV